NRVNSEAFPQTVCDVVQQERKGRCQFSWWCDPILREKSVNKLIDNETYNQIKLIALETYLLYDQINVGTKGALFYHAKYVNKKKIGVAKLEKTTTIGKHIFYKHEG
ncbi:MAG: cell wall hydrolase, partial [Vampirovibrionia bacterium]